MKTKILYYIAGIILLLGLSAPALAQQRIIAGTVQDAKTNTPLEGATVSVVDNTIHLRDLATDQYPYQQLFKLLTNMKYKGWLLLEESSNPQDKIAAMKEQLNLFNQLLITAGKA
jgi:hypothetical protein